LLHKFDDSDNTVVPVPHTHPAVIQFIQISSGVILVTTSLSFMYQIVSSVYYNHGEFGKALIVAISLAWPISLLASLIFISFYGFYFNKNIEKIASKYDREIINKQMMNMKAIVYGNNNDDDEEYDE
jgi:hypothetical protein